MNNLKFIYYSDYSDDLQFSRRYVFIDYISQKIFEMYIIFDKDYEKKEIKKFLKFDHEDLFELCKIKGEEIENYDLEFETLDFIKNFKIWFNPETFDFRLHSKILKRYYSNYKNIWYPYYLLSKII